MLLCTLVMSVTLCAVYVPEIASFATEDTKVEETTKPAEDAVEEETAASTESTSETKSNTSRSKKDTSKTKTNKSKPKKTTAKPKNDAGKSEINTAATDVNTSGQKATKKPKATESNKQDASVDGFDAKATVDGVTVRVAAPKGTFPEGASLSVKKPSSKETDKVDAAVKSKRGKKTKVARAYTFDIKVVDSKGSEIQPTGDNKVTVSFTADEVDDPNLNTRIYHVSEGKLLKKLKAESLKVSSGGKKAVVETEGFSYYTVEFTYGDKQYVLPGEGTDVALADLLKEIGLEGEIEDAWVSDPSLVYVCREFGTEEWRVAGRKPFETTEWMKVILNGIEYEIVLTDAISHGTTTEGLTSFASEAPIATVTIDKSKLLDIEYIDLIDVTNSSVKLEDGFIVAKDVLLEAKGGEGKATNLGEFTIRYENAAVMSNGVRKDLLVRYNLTVMTNTGMSGDFTATLRVMGPAGKAAGADKTGLAPCIAAAITSIPSNTRAGLRLEVDQNKGFYRIVDPGTKAKIYDEETFFFTGYGYNLGNYNSDSNPNQSSNSTIIYAGANRNWAESIIISDGLSSESDIYIPATSANAIAGGNEIYADYYSKPGKTRPGASAQNPPDTDATYVSGFATVAKANSMKTKNRNYFALGSETGTGLTTHDWVFTDGITHNYTSSSGYYGKIELWTDGKTDVSGTNGTKLYGGRYVNGTKADGSTLYVDEKRTYDVAYGKEVTYKMTPEQGYIIDKLYIDGTEYKLNTPDPEDIYSFDVQYKNDGYTPDYYTFTFAGNEHEGDLSDPDFDPRSGKGGSAHTIHVTWQPTVNLDFYKNWNDNRNMYGVRPTKLPIELKQNGVEYNAAIQSLSNKLYYETISKTRNTSIPETQPYDLTGKANVEQWQYKSPRDTKPMYRMLPMYSDYNECDNTGTLYKYTVKETLSSKDKKYYEEQLPHTTEKTDTDIAQTYLANNERPYETGTTKGYTENNLPKGTTRDITYKIDNDLKLTELMVEKEVIPGSKTPGSFDFIAKLTNEDIPTSADSTLPDSITRISGSDFRTKTLNNIPGDSFVGRYRKSYDYSKMYFSHQILANTGFKVVEKEQEAWVETSKSKTHASHNGTTYTSDVFGYYVEKTDTLYVPDGNDWRDQAGDPVDLPKWADIFTDSSTTPATVAPQTRYFDDSGLEIETGGNTGPGLSGYKYKGDGRDVPITAVTNMVTITYASPAILKSKNIVFEASKSGDNGVTEAEDIVISRRAHRAWFQNKELENLTIKKVVSGNQASKDKYFKFKVEISNAKEVDYVTLDMSKCDSDFAANPPNPNRHAIGGNAATTHNATTMNDSNKVDQITEDIKFAADDYEVINETETTNDVQWKVGASSQQIALNNGSATFYVYLQHEQEVTIKRIPLDAYYKVEEKKEDYKPYAEIEGDNVTGDELKDEDDLTQGRKDGSEIVTPPGENVDSVTDSNITKDTKITFTNKRDGTVPTEVRVPMWLIGVMLMQLAAGWLIVQRLRKRRMVYED